MKRSAKTVFSVERIAYSAIEKALNQEVNGDWIAWAKWDCSSIGGALLSLDDTESCISATASLMVAYYIALREASYEHNYNAAERALAKFEEYHEVFKSLTKEV
jgi:hypothetical protein